MSHFFYHTEGLVLGRRPSREADEFLLILSSELGLIWVLARGLRLAKSKLRTNVKEWQAARFSLVRGRETWRLVGAEVQASAPKLSLSVRRLLSRAGILVKRFVPLEAESEQIFSEFKAAIDFLSRVEFWTETDLAAAELLLALRVLAWLGYVPPATRPPILTGGHEWSKELLNELRVARRPTLDLVNAAVNASQL